ncbi:MAG: STAS domain-containing protein [Actinobacteria bacterium]|jgi:anti-anti-sigma regulatory factor|nr:STAS domain-containing protein [Actinomycetota bacterium]
MLSPILIASTDSSRQLLVMTVDGPLVDPDHVEALRMVLPAVPGGHSLIIDLTGATAFSESSLEALRSVAHESIEIGQTMVVVCGDLDRRTDLVLADLDTLVPVVEAVEQALPLTRAAA